MWVNVDMDLISSLTSRVVNKALDGYAARHGAIASNLANVDTPHYRRRDVDFEDALGRAIHQARGGKTEQASNDRALALRATRENHFAIGQSAERVEDVSPVITESDGVSFRNDGNAVDLEYEMAQMARNTERYIALSNIESRRMRSLKSVITTQT